MNLRLENDPLGYRVDSFDNNTASIGEVRYTRSLIITPEKVVHDWPPQHPWELTIDNFEAILTLEPELILVGTGNALTFPDAVTLKGVIRAGIGIDFMDSRAACRTFNILAAEGRHVAEGHRGRLDALARADGVVDHSDLLGGLVEDRRVERREKVIADRNDEQLRSSVQLHIAEQRGISCNIDPPVVFGVDQDAGGHATVGAVRQAGPVKGDGEL